jgi:hypothetical protein
VEQRFAVLTSVSGYCREKLVIRLEFSAERYIIGVTQDVLPIPEAIMSADQGKHDKNVILRQHATLNPRPDGVTHPLFKGSEFFDPHDLLQ